jgi:dienelactone hydrolase
MSTRSFSLVRPTPALAVALFAAACVSVSRPGADGTRVAHRMEQYWSVGHAIAVDRYSAVSPALAPGRRRPAVILLHGSGGMILGGGRSIRRYARALAARGFETFVVHYFDATHTWIAGGPSERRNFSRWVQTVSDGITYALRQPSTDSGRVAIVGVSLGAYLGVGAAS